MVNIVVWDNIGNVLWGLRMKQINGDKWLDRLRPDDPAAIDRAPITFEEMFAGYDIQLHECKTLAEVEQRIADADFVIIHKETLTSDVLKKGKKIRLLQHLGLDYRGVPMETARQMKIPVAATPLINYVAVAEHNWALILNWMKHLPQHRDYMKRRGYVEEGWGAAPSLKIRLAGDQTLGLLGFGEIARPMANYAKAFGMKTIYWDRVRFPELEAKYGVDYVEWDELFKRADILSTQIPITPATHKIVGAREIGLMKPTALFVNTARGKLMDQPALVDALKNRKIGGAALDVFYDEPLPTDDPIHQLHEDLSYDVTITPHSAWQGSWTHVRDSLGIWDNVMHVLKGEPIEYEVT